MPANLENSAVATGLEKVSFHSNPKEGQCQRMLKLPYFFNLTYMQSTSCEMPNWMTQFGIKIAGRNINNLTHADHTILMTEMEEEIKSLWMRVKEKS